MAIRMVKVKVTPKKPKSRILFPIKLKYLANSEDSATSPQMKSPLILVPTAANETEKAKYTTLHILLMRNKFHDLTFSANAIETNLSMVADDRSKPLHGTPTNIKKTFMVQSERSMWIRSESLSLDINIVVITRVSAIAIHFKWIPMALLYIGLRQNVTKDIRLNRTPSGTKTNSAYKSIISVIRNAVFPEYSIVSSALMFAFGASDDDVSNRWCDSMDNGWWPSLVQYFSFEVHCTAK